jgi:hypothetical protein
MHDVERNYAGDHVTPSGVLNRFFKQDCLSQTAAKQPQQ